MTLFKTDLGAYVRLYTFLSQIFDYGTTAIEKRAIFFRRLLPHLEFGRERETIDLSKVRLTHYALRDRGRQAMVMENGNPVEPVKGAGSGEVQQKEKARLQEIIERVNDLFEGELTEGDKLVYVNEVIKGKLLESPTLRAQALNNSKQQFAASPDLTQAIVEAVMDALDAHTAKSTQALNSPEVRRGLKDVLLDHAGLYEGLRGAAGAA